MDKYYGNVCELDIIFSFTKAYYILDEILLAGELQESSKKNVLRCISQQDSLEDMEVCNHRFCSYFFLFLMFFIFVSVSSDFLWVFVAGPSLSRLSLQSSAGGRTLDGLCYVGNTILTRD